MKFPTFPTSFALFSLLFAIAPASSQDLQGRSGSLLEVVATHERRITRLEADISSLRLARFPNPDASTSRPRLPVTTADSYRVKPGESLGQIAKRHGFSTAELALFNSLPDPDQLEVGQILHFPGGTSPRRAPSPADQPGTRAPSSKFTAISHPSHPSHSTHGAGGTSGQPSGGRTHSDYTVAKGDTLFKIASSYAISTSVLRDANGLSSDHIYVGQRLRIPSTGAVFGPNSEPPSSRATTRRKDQFATYRVRKGDTVSAIAREFEISPDAILEANNLSKDGGIRIGDDIKIPLDKFWATLAPPR